MKRIRTLLTAVLIILLIAVSAAASEPKVAYVADRWVTIQSKPGGGTNRTIPYMTQVELLEAEGKWQPLRLDGKTWYISKSKVSVAFTAEPYEKFVTSDNPYRQAVLELAYDICENWPTRYRAGEDEAKQDSKGNYLFDCSGFVTYVLDTVLTQWNPLYNAPHNSRELFNIDVLYNEGLPGEYRVQTVTLEEALPGDVIFFDGTDGTGVVNHCGIYVGNNAFIHCTEYDWYSGVNLMTLRGYDDNIMGIRRLIPEEITPAGTTLYSVNDYAKFLKVPDADGKIIRRLKKNEPVTVQFTNRLSYLYVKTMDGEYGYVWKGSLKEGDGFSISAQPRSVDTVSGEKAVFSVKATGSGLSYRWQYRTAPDGKWKNSGATGAKTSKLTVSATADKHGYEYRCKVTDGSGKILYSDTVRLGILGISVQPKSRKVLIGERVVFRVTSSGDGLQYQWQYRSGSDGKWKKSGATGAKTDTLKVLAKTDRSGYQYRCRITDEYGNVVYSRAAYLYALGITSQPEDRILASGERAVFSVKATGFRKTYQWQYRTGENGKWIDSTVSSAKERTVKVTATTRKDGYQYRCRITDGAGNVVYSTPATLDLID